MSYEPLVAIVRGDLDESIHYGAIAVTDADGCLVASAGSPRALTFMRSSAKPLQAVPLLESGAVRPIVHAAFPLRDAAAAHRLMESSAHIGKLVLTTSI